MSDAKCPPARRPRRGFTLVELMVALVIAGVISVVCAFSFRRAYERAQADLAAANLRSLWAAQRLYRLDRGTFAASLAELRSVGAVDPLDRTVLSPNDPAPEIAARNPTYLFEVAAADAASFIVAAIRNSPAVDAAKDRFLIDQSGRIAGEVRFQGDPADQPSVTAGRVFTGTDP